MFMYNLRFTFGSLNPAVFTDGNCYLDWIADQYNLEVGCSQSWTVITTTKSKNNNKVVFLIKPHTKLFAVQYTES